MMSGSTVSATAAATPIDIEALERNSARKICRYFLRGICRFGELCYFSHDLTGGEVIASGTEAGTTCTQPSTSKNAVANWANAPVFVPTYQQDEPTEAATPGAAGGDGVATLVTANKSWAEVVGAGGNNVGVRKVADATNSDQFCPFTSPCPYHIYCMYPLHWELCKMCDQYCLHPRDQTQRRKHNQECLQQHERDMELSFAIARSKDKTCGICFDTIMEKSGREKRFGILPNCSHIFCLECIRKWRQAKQFEHKITRSCPECRVSSDFVCPSAFWVETKEEKDKLLNEYRSALGIKDCKYFKKGDGKCPFGNKCFYKHALPNGDLVDVGVPKRARKLHRNTDELIDLLDIYLWEFVDQRDYHWLEVLGDDDSDESDWSDE